MNAQPVSPSTLDSPAAFAVTPNGGRILYGELRTGRIRWLNTGTGASATFRTVPNVARGAEQGLLGIALRPNYPDDRRVWAYVTRSVAGQVKNQLLRIRADGSSFTVLRSFPASDFHDSGRIMFGPDGKLYVVVGDNAHPALAQDLGSLAGKVLRLNPDGTVPSNNPRPQSPIIGYGVRNSFGFTFDPRSGRLWETENGPECNDEINLVARFRLENFGWGPSETCSSPPPRPRNTNRDGPTPVLPKLFFSIPPALTGAAFCLHCGLSSGGELFFGDYNNGRIHRANLNSARTGVASQVSIYDHRDGVISLETPLDGGPIYFSTISNIFRLKP